MMNGRGGVRLRHSSWEADEQGGAIRCGAGGAKGGDKENAGQQSTRRAQDRESVSHALERVRQAAKQRRKERFTALFHHINAAMLRTAFFALKRDAAAGVDGVMWQDYEADLDRRIEDLSDRVHRGAYRAQPSRRRYIPKPDGRQRPLAVAALEDKVVQRATTALLNAIYEEEFLGFSYGFRPGRGQHDALDALHVGIDSRKVNHILDADIAGFFDAVSQDDSVIARGGNSTVSARRAECPRTWSLPARV